MNQMIKARLDELRETHDKEQLYKWLKHEMARCNSDLKKPHLPTMRFIEGVNHFFECDMSEQEKTRLGNQVIQCMRQYGHVPTTVNMKKSQIPMWRTEHMIRGLMGVK